MHIGRGSECGELMWDIYDGGVFSFVIYLDGMNDADIFWKECY